MDRMTCVTAGLLGLATGLFGAALQAPQPGRAVPVTIIDVYDGDTLTVELVPQQARVRLIDCWAPELNATDTDERRRAEAAREHLRKIAKGKPATLFIPWRQNIGDETSLGRVLGRVYLKDGTDLSEAQVKAGHATITK